MAAKVNEKNGNSSNYPFGSDGIIADRTLVIGQSSG